MTLFTSLLWMEWKARLEKEVRSSRKKICFLPNPYPIQNSLNSVLWDSMPNEKENNMNIIAEPFRQDEPHGTRNNKINNGIWLDYNFNMDVNNEKI